MKFDVADIIRRATRTRRPRIILAAIEPTAGHRLDLQRIYMQVVNGWARGWREQIEPVYTRTLGEAVTDSVDDVQGSVDELSRAMNRLVVTLDAELEDWAVRVEEWHRGRFVQSFSPTGVNLGTLLGRGEARATLEATLAQNVSLIRSLNDQQRNGISGAVFRGLTNRSPARDVAREISKATGIGKNRAVLIASDQLQKLTGRLDQERQEQVGVSKFQWAHSRKLHPRPEHVARNNKIYAWSSPVGKTDPPGRAIRCGCRARPVVDLDADAAAIAEPEPTPAPAPASTPAPTPLGIGGYGPRRPNAAAGTVDVAMENEAARTVVLDNGRREGVEFLAAFDAQTGERYDVNRGGRDYCQLTAAMIAAADNPASRLVMHHNHPSSSSLSKPDVDFLKRPGVQAIAAHGHDGSMYSVQRGESRFNETVFRAVSTGVRNDLQRLISQQVIPREAASALYNHLVWKILSAQGSISYRYGLAGEGKRYAEKYKTFLDLIEAKYVD